MSTHPTILGEMIHREGESEKESESGKTSLDVERDLGIPSGTGEGTEGEGSRPDLLQTDRPLGQRRESAESE